MNKLAKAAVVVAGLALVSQVAKANDFDIILGFNGNGSTSDYVIDLGNANTSVGVGGSSVVDLSSFFNLTTFNSTFSSVNGTLMGAGGGQTASNPTLYFTENRGSLGTADTAGSSAPAFTSVSGSRLAAGHFNAIPGMTSAGANLTIVNSDPNSWTSQVTSPNPGSLSADQGLDASSQIGGGLIYEDLWRATKSGTTMAWTYTGFLTFDTTGSSDSLTFTPQGLVAVPEPSTFGLFGGAGVLALAMRRQFRRKNA
jgi:hypothetical protein